MNVALLSHTDTANASKALRYFIDGLSNDLKSLPVVYIASEPDAQRQFFNPIADCYRQLGFNTVQYVELEQDFDAQATLKVLRAAGLVHLSGGDTFRFLYWLKQRGLDKQLYHLAENGLPIVGVSAGAMILTPDISSAILCGDTNSIGLANTSALNIMPFQFVPHVKNPQEPTAQIMDFVAHTQHDLLLCSDDDAVVLHSGLLTTESSLIPKNIHYFGQPNLVQQA
ncbi:Type 1 glutamine amidotransferase-like domain-containing protein [Shewanella sp. ENK2]|uniref:Type 1 glutamine amidotransferase-like domain-containing protein n=1 Tax=Shewanella sp. ENK2 TaxID=2775245 RepID=UPI00374807AD